MKALIRMLALALVAGVFLAIVQRRQIKAARTELARLEASAPARSLTAPSEAAMGTVTAEDIVRLRAKNRDIHGLRGQITQARQRRKAFEQMQAENTELRKKIDQFKANPAAAAAESFPLSNKGQATPEAALETTFWSMYRGDTETLSRVMPLVTAEFDRMPPNERTNSITLLRAIGAMMAQYEISDRKFDSPEEAHLTVRFSRREGSDVPLPSDREHRTFVLRRTNDLWQIIAER